MRSDRYSFCSNDIFDSVNMASRNKDIILDQIHEKKIEWRYLFFIILYYKLSSFLNAILKLYIDNFTEKKLFRSDCITQDDLPNKTVPIWLYLTVYDYFQRN